MSEDHVHEEEIVDVSPEKDEPRRGPMVEYVASYNNKKGQLTVIQDVRGFQFDGGFYFLFVMVEGFPVPEVHVLDLSSPNVNNLRVTPVNIIEHED